MLAALAELRRPLLLPDYIKLELCNGIRRFCQRWYFHSTHSLTYVANLGYARFNRLERWPGPLESCNHARGPDSPTTFLTKGSSPYCGMRKKKSGMSPKAGLPRRDEACLSIPRRDEACLSNSFCVLPRSKNRHPPGALASATQASFFHQYRPAASSRCF
jgi:hypothetical protein